MLLLSCVLVGIWKETFLYLIGCLFRNLPGGTEEYHEIRRVICCLFRVWMWAPLRKSRQPHRMANLLGCSDGLWTGFKEGSLGLLATTARRPVSSAVNLQHSAAYSRTQDQTATVDLSLWSRRTGMIGWSCHQLVLLQAVARWRCEQCVMERWTAGNTLPLHRLHPLPSPGANMWHKLNYTERQRLCLLISWIRNENKAWSIST